MKRYAHNLSHTETSTVNMGKCYPCNILEVFPGDSFKITAKDLTRFLPQVAPTMHDVFIGVDTFQVPIRQLMDKLHMNWDDFLTGGEDGTIMMDFPEITIPEGGYEPGSLADFLGYPTNWTDPSTNTKHVVAVGKKFSAIPVLVYMHIINENYRDQNFIQKFDFTKYQEFLDGTYQFKDASGNNISWNLTAAGLFPKAWSRDYFGRALPSTQRGPEATVPVVGNALLNPTTAPVETIAGFVAGSNSSIFLPSSTVGITSTLTYDIFGSTGTVSKDSFNIYSLPVPSGTWFKSGQETLVGTVSSGDTVWNVYQTQTGTAASAGTTRIVRVSGTSGNATGSQSSSGITGTSSSNKTVANLSGINADIANATAMNLIAFRTAARMQQFGEALQQAGARAVEFTLKFFGVRIPDGRVQRPLFHGSFDLPVIFSEVLQTSQSSDTSPLATLGGHGITGGVNKPIHIKVIEHGFIMSIMHVMPRSQFQNITPRYLLRKNRYDLPNPLFQGMGEQGLKRVEIYPDTSNPDENFGYVPQYAELMSIPSTLHGHMKDTFLHWTMARVYTSEPVLSANWRYEKPSDRSFAVQNEDQMQVCIGFEIASRRCFTNRPRPGIHVV